MHKLNQLKHYFLNYFLNFLLVILVSTIGLLMANSAMAQAATVVSNNAANNTNTNTSNNTSDTKTIDSIEQSYIDMAKLNQEIEFAQRELTARGLKKQLQAMQQQEDQKDLGFTVASIEGFDAQLYAVLLENNGGILRVQPGGDVNGLYKVTRITPSEVQVMDRTSNNVFVVPFSRLEIKSAPSVPVVPVVDQATSKNTNTIKKDTKLTNSTARRTTAAITQANQ